MGGDDERTGRFEDPVDLGKRCPKRRSWKVMNRVVRDDARERPRTKGHRAHVATSHATIPSASARHLEHPWRQVHSNDDQSAFGKVLTNLARTATEVENGLSGSDPLDDPVKDL